MYNPRTSTNRLSQAPGVTTEDARSAARVAEIAASMNWAETQRPRLSDALTDLATGLRPGDADQLRHFWHALLWAYLAVHPGKPVAALQAELEEEFGMHMFGFAAFAQGFREAAAEV